MTHRPHPAHRSQIGRTISPRQCRLEFTEGLTGPELDVFVATGFIEDAGFRRDAVGTWQQTRIESDESRPAVGDRA